MANNLNTLKVGVVFPPGAEADVWSSKYDAGQVPDRWPYGLHRLTDEWNQTIPLQSTPMRMGDKAALAGRLLRRGKAFRGRNFQDVGIAWDEYTAAKMMAQNPAASMFSGVIWATDSWTAKGEYLRSAASKRLLTRFSGLWCLSRPQVYETQRHLKNRVPVDFLSFGIDTNFFKYTEPPKKRRILSLGVDRDRDPKTLFEALELVHRASPDTEIMVQTDSVMQLPAGVTRFDRVPHAVLRDLYRTASVVLVPTKHNLHASGMTVALEAGATGRPVVACSTPGMEDYLVHGHTGFLVPPGDSRAMANATLEILHDRKLASSLGSAARKHVELSHNSEQMVECLAKIISKGT